MTAMEDRLRLVLRQDGEPVVLEELLADVHQGARRRAARRRAATTAAVAAGIAASVGLAVWLTSLLTEGRDDPPPADVVPLDSPQLMVPMPAPDGRLYGLAGSDCASGCPSVLWIQDGDGRARKVHTFTADQGVSWVDLAPDLQHGFAFGSGARSSTTVWRTADGGRTWTQVDEDLADYGYPPDVEYLGDDAYLLTRPMSGGSPSDSSPHLWRTPVDGGGWDELVLPRSGDFSIDLGAGLFTAVAADGRSTRLGVVLGDSVLTTDSDGWEAAVDLPCARAPNRPGPAFAGDTPSTLMVWCPAASDRTVQLFRSVGFGPFERLGQPLETGKEYPTSYPQLVGPFPVETRDDGAYAVVRVGDDFLRLTPRGGTKPIRRVPQLLSVADPWGGSTHGGGHTYTATPSGVITTGDAGLSWSPLGR